MKSQIEVINVNERTSGSGLKRTAADDSVRERQQKLQDKRQRTRRKKQRLQIIRLVMSAVLMAAACLMAAAFLRIGSVGETEEPVFAETANENQILDENAGNVDTNLEEEIVELEEEIVEDEEETPAVLKYEVGTPQVLEGYAITARLQELAEQYPEFQEICENEAAYPEDLLAALCNNPEMIDFVKGYLTADTSAAGELTEEEKQSEHPHFLQWDDRWGYTVYGDDILALTGCGPTCLAMVTVALTDNKDITPADVADFAISNGYYMMGTGTMWKLMTEGAADYGLSAVELDFSEAAMKYCIDNGGMIIATMAPGDFTAVGHFIVIYGYDEEGFLVNDPNCLARSQTKWDFETLCSQMKKMWGYQYKN